MGHATAAGYAEMAEIGSIGLSTALDAHRASNLYPPPPAIMLGVMVAAVEAVQGDPEDGYREVIDLPEGVQYHDADTVTAGEVIEAFRLDAFV